ncbi:Protein HESO1 [Bienertia sinuspersici]
MGTNSTVGLLQLAEGMSKDVLMAAKVQEVLGLQNNKGLFTRLSPFQILLDDVYGILCPRSEDYASRRDLIRIFNDIAREIYGNNDKCPVVENFGSFLMDMFDGKSDLDLSINFSDQLLETDRIAKRKTLRKFAKKFYSLRSKGHVTTVELILSARVPVLKVTDSGSGIECDLSVGNRDGITKSRIVLMISAIDERFRQLSLMMKVWAKAHDINSSKDGTLNSLSLILLAAFHLQTLDIPILPPFSAIFKDGLDPEAVKKNIPSFLKYGERNKESLAELFVSLFSLWKHYGRRELSASTYEGSWVHRNSKANGYISIEDFTDRSQNTARAVRSKKMNKIYSCIRRSVELIQSFTDGIIDATQLKNRLFGLGPSFRTKIANLNCSNLSQRKKKCPSQGGPVEGQKTRQTKEQWSYS